MIGTELLAGIDWRSPTVWRILSAWLLSVLALGLALPAGQSHSVGRRLLAACVGAFGLSLLWWDLSRWGSSTYAAAFWILAVVTLVSAVATVASHSPVYCAVWFAVTLLGTAGLFLLQGAQFLGIATVAVYAGAIVVTFLFVLMLAQPEGHTFYDRVSWGSVPSLLASLAAVGFVVLTAIAVSHPDRTVLSDRELLATELQSVIATAVPEAELRDVRWETSGDRRLAWLTIAVPAESRMEFDNQRPTLTRRILLQIRSRHADWQISDLHYDLQDVKSVDHTASLGGLLFSRHLITIQAAGTLLLAALVGAVAIASRTDKLDA